MTEVMIRKRNVVSDELRVAAAKKSLWHRPALAVVLILSAFLNLFHLTDEGYGIPYYAAAVKDMLTSWHNFFFVSFAGARFVADGSFVGSLAARLASISSSSSSASAAASALTAW